MTQEEKAKAYDEALEDLRVIYPNLRGDAKLAVEHAFPELAESEDERIRKYIVDFVKLEKGVNLPPDDADRMLAYLEKQKEQKPVHTAKEMWKEMRLEIYAQASGNRHEPNYSDDSTKMFSLCDIDEIFEKISNSTVGSQPVEWSEEDETRLANILIMLKEYAIHHYSKDDVEKSIDWLENRVKSLRPQSKPGWNDGDEEMLDLVIGDVTDAKENLVSKDAKDFCDKEIAWLKSLPERFILQPKQEWSEEGKRKLNRIYEILGQAADEKPFGSSKRIIGDKEAVELQDFIKSLCPSWKPSEEQIMVLKWCKPLFYDPKLKKTLESLIDDLEKLM